MFSASKCTLESSTAEGSSRSLLGGTTQISGMHFYGWSGRTDWHSAMSVVSCSKLLHTAENMTTRNALIGLLIGCGGGKNEGQPKKHNARRTGGGNERQEGSRWEEGSRCF